MKFLITGAAGFIGFHLVMRLHSEGHTIIGLDNINNYYNPALKYARLQECGISQQDVTDHKLITSQTLSNYSFVKADLLDRDFLQQLFADEHFEVVVNLAAQAGVRYSLENPYSYIESNIVGFLNLLECARHNPVKHFVYASSSSVYGGNKETPFSESHNVDNPVSLYAATKKSNELMAHVYSKLYGIPTTGLRFFTVYGPWGRPDMAPMLFAKAILKGQPIKVFNNGNLSRDFTYIDDIIEGVDRIIPLVPTEEIPAKVFNIGCGHPMQLMDFIHTMEQVFHTPATLEMKLMQPGDVYTTYADTTRLHEATGYAPSTTLLQGLTAFSEWYNSKNPLR